MEAGRSGTNLAEIRTHQFVAALSIQRMHRCGRLANQIAILIECTEKAFFVRPEMRFHPLESIDGDKKGIFNRGIISPKPYGPCPALCQRRATFTGGGMPSDSDMNRNSY